MTIQKISSSLATYEPFYERILRTGSRVICDPPVTDTDEDYLVLCTQDQRQQLETRLQADGWTLGGSLPNGEQVFHTIDTTINPWGVTQGTPDYTLNTQHEYKNGVIDHAKVFHSWKRLTYPESTTEEGNPEVNLLVTCNETYFDDFTRATFLCQGLNLLEKEDRVMVFEALTRDVWPSGRKKKKNSVLYEKYGKAAWKLISQTPPMTAMDIMQLQQAQNDISPPVVLPDVPHGAGIGLDINGEWTILHAGQVIPG